LLFWLENNENEYLFVVVGLEVVVIVVVVGVLFVAHVDGEL
jgi:hypothetical protein